MCSKTEHKLKCGAATEPVQSYRHDTVANYTIMCGYIYMTTLVRFS